tara:strand:+ start:799 stop:1113 length:315 start_codon:yes stop_codon:yes gene_type:complete
MEELEPIGLITDPKIKNYYVDKFGTSLTLGSDYQVYVSEKHGNGAGQYKIQKIKNDNNKIRLNIAYTIKPLEIGSAVINQRVLFFKVEPNCKIIEVISSNIGQK